MRKRQVLSLFGLLSIAALSGCSGSDPKEEEQEATSYDISVEPTKADVLTCDTLQLTATVDGKTENVATWSVDGKGKNGAVSEDGLFSAPNVLPDPNEATVTATSIADTSKSASSDITLHTALPQKAVVAGSSYDTSIFDHQMAARGKHAYVVLPTRDRSADPYTFGLQVAASSDGGKTFGDPVTASDVPDSQIAIDCTAIAVDAEDEETVYVSYVLDAGAFSQTSAPTASMSGKTLALAVSKDGGATFESYVLESHVSGWGECPDVASPAAGTVVVEAPAYDFSTPYLTTYVDTNSGAGFAEGDGDESAWLTAEVHEVSAPWSDLDHNGGSYGMESPRLIAGKDGHVCVTYVGAGDGTERVAVQCSDDSGKTFADPIDVAIAAQVGDFHHPTGAFSADGKLAIAYWEYTADGDASLYLALSEGGGKTFDEPLTVPAYELPESVGLTGTPQYPAVAWDGDILWMSYLVGDGLGAHRLVVDKTCDLGESWSGAVLLNGPEPDITDDYQWPGMFVLDGAPHVFSQRAISDADNSPYDLIRLSK